MNDPFSLIAASMMTSYLKLFSVLLAVLFPPMGSASSNPIRSEVIDANAIEQKALAQRPLPSWITEEGVRAGFMSSTSGDFRKISHYIELAKDIGLNTAIVYGCSFAETSGHLRMYREWLRLCNQANLHVFLYYAWQPPVGNECRPVVFSDGTKGLFPCPLDDKLWRDYLIADMAGKLAKLSKEEPQYSFDGFFLDMEMYRTEKQPTAKRYYSLDTCFCDYCFSSFLFTKGYAGPTLPALEKRARKQWLKNNGYLSDYYASLATQVRTPAQQLKNSIRSVNPELLFGIYPALSQVNWVHTTIAGVLGRDSYPVISFTTDTFGYHSIPWGAARIPRDLSAYFREYDINGIYVAGYLFRAYTSEE
ncbi:MAG: hypothetical protein ACYSUG_07475, partial [Planctomycetota bacterium]